MWVVTCILVLTWIVFEEYRHRKDVKARDKEFSELRSEWKTLQDAWEKDMKTIQKNFLDIDKNMTVDRTEMSRLSDIIKRVDRNSQTVQRKFKSHLPSEYQQKLVEQKERKRQKQLNDINPKPRRKIKPEQSKNVKQKNRDSGSTTSD